MAIWFTATISVAAGYAAYRFGWLRNAPHIGWSLLAGYALAEGVFPTYSDHDAFAMAQAGLDLAVRRVLCAGARFDRIAALDNYCWPDPVQSDRTPDGERNALRINRLKDKLGNKSNASSEVEFAGAYAELEGEEGRGIATIAQELALRHPAKLRSLVLGCTTSGGPREVRVEGNALAVAYSTAPMSAVAVPSLFPSRIRGTPRWSIAATAVLLPASITGLPASGVCVHVGPPLSCSGPSRGSTPSTLPAPPGVPVSINDQNDEKATPGDAQAPGSNSARTSTPSTIATTAASNSAACPATKTGSTSMPIETKNNTENRSRSGITSPSV